MPVSASIPRRFELYGTGTPLVLIGGLGADLTMLAVWANELAEHHQVLTFDNRGAGRSLRARPAVHDRTWRKTRPGSWTPWTFRVRTSWASPWVGASLSNWR